MINYIKKYIISVIINRVKKFEYALNLPKSNKML